MLEFDTLSSLSWIYYFLVLILSLLLIKGYGRFYGPKLPPGPSSWPILGSVGFFRAFKKRRHLLLADLTREYGNIFGVYAGTQLVVFLNGYDAIREAFVKQSSIFSGRPNWLPSLQNGLLEGKGLVWQNYELSPPVRKFALQGLKEFGVGKISLQYKVQTEVAAMKEIFDAKIGQPFNVKPTIRKAIMNIIHELVFGERNEYDSKDSDLLHNLINEYFKGGIFIPKNFVPKIIRTFLPKEESVYQEKQKIIGQLKDYIYSRISDHESKFEPDNIRDFVDLYLVASNDTDMTESNTSNFRLDKGEIFRIILDLFLAGSETTSNSLIWCIMFMVKYPDIQNKCYNEITEICDSSSGSVIEWSMRDRLPYTRATLEEVQRLATIAPLGLPHSNSEPAQLLGYDIPKDTIIFANIYSCTMDPVVWEEPGRFIPDRHLDENRKFKQNKNNIPFSIGPRMCLGDNMAKVEMFLIFTNIIKDYQLSCLNKDDISVVSVKEDQPLSTTTDFEVVITKRVPME
ncbi:cytochrome P450 2 subfamily U member 1 [Mactra antiquata]